jgi:hypothetical protein
MASAGDPAASQKQRDQRKKFSPIDSFIANFDPELRPGAPPRDPSLHPPSLVASGEPLCLWEKISPID